MKVSVLGAGAIGSMFGGLLKLRCPEIDVMLVARGDHARVLQERGTVRLRGAWGEDDVAVACSNDVSAIGGSDLVLLTVKSQATAEALESAREHLGDARVVSIQNGINDATCLDFVAPDRLAMAMTETNMALITPGEVSLQLGGLTVLGPAAGQPMGPHIEWAAEVLSRITGVGLRTIAHPNALGMRYNKLTINALGYASCVSASNFISGAIGNPAWRRHVGRPLIEECKRVYSAAGVSLERVPGRSNLSNIERLMTLLDVPLIGQAVRLGTYLAFKKRPVIFSLYQDLLHDKKTEIDFVNGEVVRLAKSVGMEAPINSLFVQLAHELEQRPGASFFGRDEVIARVRTAHAEPIVT